MEAIPPRGISRGIPCKAIGDGFTRCPYHTLSSASLVVAAEQVKKSQSIAGPSEIVAAVKELSKPLENISKSIANVEKEIKLCNESNLLHLKELKSQTAVAE